MNIVRLNTVSIDGIIKKGSGGGVAINNQEKSLEITENGVTEVTADAGFTGLSKVKVTTAIPTEEKEIEITENGTTEVVADNGFLSKVVVNTNVQSGGGSDFPIIGDGKTYLYIEVPDFRRNVTLVFGQTISNGVFVDWGDGTALQTIDGQGTVAGLHLYPKKGKYRISLEPIEGCIMTLGLDSAAQSSLMRPSPYDLYIKYVEVGNAKLGKHTFVSSKGLREIYLPSYVTSIPEGCFMYCHNLSKVTFDGGVTSFGENAFYQCLSLIDLELPQTLNSIGKSSLHSCPTLVFNIPPSVLDLPYGCFMGCSAAVYFDFSKHTEIPTVQTYSFQSLASDCKMIVPDALYEDWLNATNWSAFATYIIKKSDWDTLNS